MLMYFNIKSFKDRKVVYYGNDISININIPSLNITRAFENTYFADPGWYFKLWVDSNGVKYKDVDIYSYIDHFWYGSEGRNKNIDDYYKRLNKFKEDNKIHLT